VIFVDYFSPVDGRRNEKSGIIEILYVNIDGNSNAEDSNLEGDMVKRKEKLRKWVKCMGLVLVA